MDLGKRVELECKSTIGFTEAENKESFLVGVSVSFIKTTEYYEQEIQSLKNQLKSCRESTEYYKKDLEALSDIIHRHSNND